MDRINIKCPIEGQEIELQLDKKAMPSETGPCYMITADGCFKGYIAKQSNGSYKSLGAGYFTGEELQQIIERLKRSLAMKD
jgi:hypothetical protein